MQKCKPYYGDHCVAFINPYMISLMCFLEAMSIGVNSNSPNMFFIQTHLGFSRVSVCSSANNLSKGDQTESEVP